MRRDPIRLLYVALERLRPGSAATTHVGEIFEGLRRLGVAGELIAEAGEPGGGRATLGRYGRVLTRGIAALRRSDIVYIRSHFAALPLALAARALGKPVIHEINGTYEDALVTHRIGGSVARLLRAMQRTQYRGAAALVAVTPDLAAWAACEAGHGRVHVVPNAANTDLFRPDGPRTARERPYAIFFGGLTRWHGVDTMIGAAARPEWPPDLDLVVAGPVVDPSLDPLLRAAPAKVAYLGPVPQAELPGLIRGAVAAMVPISDPGGRSQKGVLPLKLYEGLACGVPAVVTDLKGQADLVRSGGCGLVVPVDDPAALAQAVASLARDPERARLMGEAGARLVAAEHSWTARARQTRDIVADVVPD